MAKRVLSIITLFVMICFGVLGSFLINRGNVEARLKEASDLNNSVTLRYFIDSTVLDSPATDVYVDNQEDISKDIVIPEFFVDEFGKHYVESLGYHKLYEEDSFFFNSSLNIRSNIDIDASRCSRLKRINDYAFYEESNIIGITLPNSIHSIGNYVSYVCPKTTYSTNNPNIQFIDNHNKTFSNNSYSSYVGPNNSSIKDFTNNKKYTDNGIQTIKYTLSYPGQNKDEPLVLRDHVYLLSTREGDNTSVTAETKEALRKAAALECPAKEYYDFAGWYDRVAADGFTPAGKQVIGADGIIPESLSVTEETTLYAGFTPHVYKISYEGDLTDEEKKTLTASHTYGTRTVLPEISRKGYLFDGWYTDASFTGEKLEVLSETVHDNVTLYPKWTPVRYSVVFDGNGADTGTMEKLSMTYGEAETLPANTFRRTGYGFGGWSIQPNGGGDCYADGETVSSLCEKQDATVTLYARWIPQLVTYKVTYTYEELDKNINFESMTQERLALAGSDITVEPQERYGFETPQAKNVTVKGDGTTEVTFHYMRKYFNVSIAGKEHPGIASFTGAGSYKYASLVGVTIRAENGYSVTSYTYSGKETEKLPEGTPATNAAIILYGDTTLDAEASLNTYKIRYNITGGSSENSPWIKEPDTDYTTKEEVILPKEESLYRKGYSFEGWYDNAEFSGDPVMKIAKGDYGDKTYYGKWRPLLYTVTYVCEGIIHGTVNDTFLYDEEREVTLPADVTRDGYEFTGWYDNVYRTGNPISVIPAGTNDNKVFYAGWKAKKYTITYHTDNGILSDTAPSGYTTGDTVLLPTEKDVVKKGFRFEGWYRDEYHSGDPITSLEADAYGNKNFYAKWSTRPYTITYDAKGGTINSGKVENYEYGTTVNLPADVTRKGYSFKGWWNGTRVVKKLTAETYGNITLSAVWQNNSSTGINLSVYIDGNKNTYYTEDGDYKQVQADNISNVKTGYYYKGLSDVEKTLYRALYSVYKLDITKVSNPFTEDCLLYSKKKFTEKDYYDMQTAFYLDHPEIFWARFFYSNAVWQKEDGTYATCVIVTPAYEETLYKADLLQVSTYFNKALKAIKIKSSDSVYTKLKKIYDYVIKNYSYDNLGVTLNANTSDDTRSVGRMLYTKVGCCEGYAKLIKLFCDYYKIECVLVASDEHMWNQVKIGSSWYGLDATWDDEGSSTSYEYFLKGKKAFSDKSHKIVGNLFVNEDGTYATEYGSYKSPSISSKNYKPSEKTTLKKGSTFTVKGLKYKVLTVNTKTKKATLTVTGPVKKTIKSVTIPASVKKNGITCSVTRIGKNAFRNCKKLKKATIGKNVTVLETKAFSGDRKLKKITFKTGRLKTVGKNAFSRIHKKAVIRAPKSSRKIIKKKTTGYRDKTMKIK